jgi:two-component system sensor histidine kinase/response regulator
MKRVLVIEDTPEVLSFVREAIKFKGWQPLTATDGEQGLQLALNQQPDLILCDVQMPRMDGYEVLEKLRQTKASIPFIFITGEGEKPSIRHGMELGADDYLVKPFTIDELLGAMETRLKIHDALASQADERLNRLRGNLSQALPHELVTPLNSILGFAGLLMEGVPPEDVRECAEHIYASATRLHSVIETFLFYSQLEMAASDPARAAAFRSGETSRAKTEIHAAAERTARENKREADLQLNLADSEIPISPRNLHRLVIELVDNAFKFSDAGTSVEVKSELSGDAFHLQVLDHGRGLTSEQLANIGAHGQFDRNLQEQQGTGLGIAIVKRLAQLHGGTFWMESIPYLRTITHLQMPVVRSEK